LQQKIDNIILKVRKKENLFVYVVLSFRLIWKIYLICV
jgi:hypothetical protein